MFFLICQFVHGLGDSYRAGNYKPSSKRLEYMNDTDVPLSKAKVMSQKLRNKFSSLSGHTRVYVCEDAMFCHDLVCVLFDDLAITTSLRLLILVRII